MSFGRVATNNIINNYPINGSDGDKQSSNLYKKLRIDSEISVYKLDGKY